MSLFNAQAYLSSFINYEINLQDVNPSLFKLDRAQRLLALLGNPHGKLKFVHVAGTKGKGSTCVLIASILREAGYRVGLYTSPHLYNYRERIRFFSRPSLQRERKNVLQGMISEGALSKTLEKMKPSIETVRADASLGRLSFFELFTVLAIFYFYRQRADFVVLETGLGGRLDATNVVDSCVCAITPVSLDHTKQLGSTIAAIAAEKAAIIKNKNQKVVVAQQHPEARRVIEKRCRQFGIEGVWAGKDIRYELLSRNIDQQTFNITTKNKKHLRLRTRLLGDHQILNASVAVGIAECLQGLGFAMADQAIKQGIAKTVWPGRFEMIQKNPVVVLDGAHNTASMTVLTKTVRSIFPRRKIIVVLGLSQDKDKAGIAVELNKIARTIILTKADHPRSCDLAQERLDRFFPGKEMIVTDDIVQAQDRALKEASKEDVVLVTGSLFVIGEMRVLFGN